MKKLQGSSMPCGVKRERDQQQEPKPGNGCDDSNDKAKKLDVPAAADAQVVDLCNVVRALVFVCEGSQRTGSQSTEHSTSDLCCMRLDVLAAAISRLLFAKCSRLDMYLHDIVLVWCSVCNVVSTHGNYMASQQSHVC